jgi:hypothetical protein
MSVFVLFLLHSLAISRNSAITDDWDDSDVHWKVHRLENDIDWIPEW